MREAGQRPIKTRPIKTRPIHTLIAPGDSFGKRATDGCWHFG